MILTRMWRQVCEKISLINTLEGKTILFQV